MTRKPFPFSVCEQCCGSGEASPKQIEEAVEKYFEENPDAGSGMNPDDYYTAEQLDEYFEEQEAVVAKKTEETILYEDVVNTPEWTNQPAVLSGDVASTFDANDFYYITLKDADGTALPSGQFMLKDFYTEAATVYPVVFSLSNLNTGSTTLVENYPVEFTSGGIIPKMRDAGVWDVTVNPSNWKLNGSRGFLRLVCSGQLAQRMSGAYIISLGTPDKNVSHYHSANTTAFQSDSTKQIIDYATISSVQSYKDNKFCDEFIIERLSDTRYITKRNVAMRCASYSGNTYTASSQMVIGYGDMSENTFITGLSIRFAVKNDRGFIRNGSVIRVTEVK